ncbi:MAG: type II toxin-antitoxin system VapC family toxin [Saprospiraceae bacterium]|nr:type II toxin-antitoxin system VapC family toxin [Saprospiraceae bacterium]
MKQYLIDTHTLIWTLLDSKLLSKKAIEVLSNPENKIFVSVISLWEISLKYALGKLQLRGGTPQDLLSGIYNLNIDILNLDPQIIATFYQLPLTFHKDPFDRLIVWQAINHALPLISKDVKLKDYGKDGLVIIW